jgi:RimJ/RimL family protein N-acetyltransferase
MPLPQCKMGGHYYLRDLQKIYSAPDVAEFLGTPGECTTNEYICDVIEDASDLWDEPSGPFLWVAVDRSLDTAIAIIRWQDAPTGTPRHWEVVYAVHPDHRRKGYATEAVTASITNELAAGRTQIVGRLKPTNIESRTLLEKLGFAFCQKYQDHWDGEQHVYLLSSKSVPTAK